MFTLGDPGPLAAQLVGVLFKLVAIDASGWLYPFDGALAWPWFALLGSGTTFLVGWLAATPAGDRAAVRTLIRRFEPRSALPSSDLLGDPP